jgi:hypothetical protein
MDCRGHVHILNVQNINNYQEFDDYAFEFTQFGNESLLEIKDNLGVPMDYGDKLSMVGQLIIFYNQIVSNYISIISNNTTNN